jgi:hypothetical protein
MEAPIQRQGQIGLDDVPEAMMSRFDQPGLYLAHQMLLHEIEALLPTQLQGIGHQEYTKRLRKGLMHQTA